MWTHTSAQPILEGAVTSKPSSCRLFVLVSIFQPQNRSPLSLGALPEISSGYDSSLNRSSLAIVLLGASRMTPLDHLLLHSIRRKVNAIRARQLADYHLAERTVVAATIGKYPRLAFNFRDRIILGKPCRCRAAR